MSAQPAPLSETPPSPPAQPGGAQAYLLFAISAVLVLTVGTVVQLISFSIGLVITELVLILVPAILFVRFKRLPIARALGWSAVTPSTALLSIVVGVTAWGAAAGIHELSVLILGEPPDMAGLLPTTVPELLLLLFCAALLPGICEETLFRGAIQGVLSRGGPRKAVLVTAILFSVYHLNPWILVPAFFLGVVFGTLVVRTGSTVPAVLAHLSNNATSLTVAFLYRDRTDASAYVLMALLAAGFLVVFAVVWMRTRAARVEPPLLAGVPARLTHAVAWILGLLGGGAVLLIVAGVAGLLALVDIHRMSSDALAPEIETGDMVIVMTAGILPLDLEDGDVVAFRRDGETLLRKTTRIEDDRVWILDGASEVELARAEVTGKVVHVTADP